MARAASLPNPASWRDQRARRVSCFPGRTPIRLHPRRLGHRGKEFLVIASVSYCSIRFLMSLLLLLLAPPAEAAPVVELLDPVELRKLEAEQGYTLVSLLDAEKPGVKPLTPNARFFSGSSRYAAVVARLEQDFARIEKEFGRPLAVNSKNAYQLEAQGNVPRRFDLNWLSSRYAWFELIGVVNRMDRRDFDEPERKTCGEVRFIYRLAYTVGGVSSRLPFFFNLITRVEAPDCAAYARLWQGHTARELLPALSPEVLKFEQLELNLQAVRLPSGMEREFGGQAMYLFRIFRKPKVGSGGAALVPVPLENTPDPAWYSRHPESRERLIEFLESHADELDQGTIRIPDFGAAQAEAGSSLQEVALSFSTHGHARLPNRPFRSVLQAAELVGLPYGRMKYIKSPQAALERLEGLSCMGCHQSNGTAGFHLLGFDRPGFTGATNELAVGYSPHFARERARRQEYVAQLQRGAEPVPLRPHPLLPPPGTERPERRDFCLKSNAHFEGPVGCASPDEECETFVVNPALEWDVGQCVLKREVFRKNPASLGSGVACMKSELRSSSDIDSAFAPNLRGYTDRVATSSHYGMNPGGFDAENLACRPPSIGVPQGRSFRLCTEREKRLEDLQDGIVPREVCAIAGGKAFDECAKGNNFHNCFDAAITRGMLDTCSADSFCREDYICQKFPAGLKIAGDPEGTRVLQRNITRLQQRGVGFCTPNYFLFQMRLDGHPDPVSGRGD